MTKLLHVSFKIWIFCWGIIFLSIVFLCLILTLKIDQQITITIKVSDYGKKILIDPQYINFLVPTKKLMLNIKHEFLQAQITNIKFNHQTNFYEVEINNLPALMPNSSISARIIYGQIYVINYIFTSSV